MVFIQHSFLFLLLSEPQFSPRAPWLSGVISEANVPPWEGDQSVSLNSPGDVMCEPSQVVQVWMEGKGGFGRYLQATLNRI